MTQHYSTTYTRLHIAGALSRNGTIRLAQMQDAYYTGEHLERDAAELHALLRHVLPRGTFERLKVLCVDGAIAAKETP